MIDARQSGSAQCRSCLSEEEVRVGTEIDVQRISSLDGGGGHNRSNNSGTVVIGYREKCP
jgi:hypothetical protein